MPAIGWTASTTASTGVPAPTHTEETYGQPGVAGAGLQWQAVLGASLVLHVVAQCLVDGQAVTALQGGAAGGCAAQTCVFCGRPVDALARQGPDAGGFGTRGGQLELTGAFPVLLRQPILRSVLEPLTV